MNALVRMYIAAGALAIRLVLMFFNGEQRAKFCAAWIDQAESQGIRKGMYLAMLDKALA